MPLIFQQDITNDSKVGLWDISENEYFFSKFVISDSDISHPLKRLQTMAGRNLLIELFPDLPLHLVEIAPTKKPFIPGDPFHFSISHCRNFAAAIVSRTARVGVDVELCGDKIIKIKNKFLTEIEQSILDEISKPEKLKLTICWSLKEAMFKWYGLGKIDFKKNLIIKSLQINNEDFTATCTFKKDIQENFTLEGKIFGDLCLAWINES